MALMTFHTELGEPGRIRDQVRELRFRAATIHHLTEMLQQVSTRGVWDSCAGTMFADEVGRCPETLYRIANGLDEAASVIAPYPDLLAESQRVMGRERDRYEEYVKLSDQLKARLDGMSPEDPEYARVDRAWRDAADEREMAKRRYQSEGEQATLDEEAVAARLDEVAVDRRDPAGYDFFEGLDDLGTSAVVTSAVTAVVPALRPVKLLRLAEPIGKLGLRAFYDQGSYTAVGNAAGQALLDLVKVPVGKGAAADDVVRKAGRSREATASKARHAGGRSRVVTKAKQTTAQAKVRGKHIAQDGFEDVTGIRLITNMTSDWTAIAGAGHVTKGAHVLKYTAASAQKVGSTVGMAQKTADTARPKKEKKSVAPPSEQCKR